MEKNNQKNILIQTGSKRTGNENDILERLNVSGVNVSRGSPVCKNNV